MFLINLGTSTLVKDTTKSADLISWIGAIQATGGNDCPEFSLTGIEVGTYLYIHLYLAFSLIYLVYNICFKHHIRVYQ